MLCVWVQKPAAACLYTSAHPAAATFSVPPDISSHRKLQSSPPPPHAPICWQLPFKQEPRFTSARMCFLSVECSCKHNIAIQNPNKMCIRPRHPKGCWLIRRGDPVNSRCPGCVEYFAPTTEQLTWGEVMSYHLDNGIDWSEATLSNVIIADRNRHNGCEFERLDLRRRIRWKLMVKWDMLPGWKLTDRGAMVPIDPESLIDYDEENERNEEAVETDEEEENNQQPPMTWSPGTGQETPTIDSLGADLGELKIGYVLKRVAGGRLETVHDDPADTAGRAEADMDENENDEANKSFQLTSSTETSASTSDGSVNSDPIVEDLGIEDLDTAGPPTDNEDTARESRRPRDPSGES
ncbi:hypothetical protein TWF696_008501 [Orbilia brochopaga]|uniref:HNH nuclease domain-containing protein n=1 Tax=Orbilia brochopaga TaxID=3140254 RepID=A0AAV9UK06_9PEZI